jgi:hypothetical protein
MGNLNKKKNIEEVVANCDQLGEVDAKCDHLKGLSQNAISRMVRSQNVILEVLQYL